METNNDIKNSVNNLAKIQWACRRGMLELDVLLGKFLKKAYLSLPLDDKVLFITLLDQPDSLLFAWLIGYEVPKDQAMAKITEMIRFYARSSL